MRRVSEAEFRCVRKPRGINPMQAGSDSMEEQA